MELKLLIGLAVILLGAELFTNAVEWLGVRLSLSEGAVGNILAAVGTALPESIIPIIAIIFSSDKETAHIGIGAILGAPFMLGTLALCITGLAARFFRWRGQNIKKLNVDIRIVKRDILFFIIMYSLALCSSLTLDATVHKLIALFLVLSYILYVKITVSGGKEMVEKEIKPLYFSLRKRPGLLIIIFQNMLALAIIIRGASFFIEGIQLLAVKWCIPPLILSLIIAPIATELPEKFNSIIWISRRKDMLAMGNITGAMVFQSSLIPAFGMVFTNWQLNNIAFLSGLLVILSTVFLSISILVNRSLKTSTLIMCGFFYLIFIAFVTWGAISYA